MPMKEAVSCISTYSADTFGVCSALFELGGMIVIHDPSGCNSTYTTHDEPRWYDTDSLIFISGLTETDAVLGNEEKLADDVLMAAADFSPAFIVLLCTPVPLMMGTDFAAIGRLIEAQAGIPVFAAPTNSMDTYDAGASWAFELLAKYMVKAPAEALRTGFCCSWQPEFASCGSVVSQGQEKKTIGVNVIGLTPLDFAVNGSDVSIREFLEGCGCTVISSWAMGSTLAEIEQAAAADVNLVVSYSGLAAAKELQRRFGTPYVVGVPLGRSLQGGIAMDIRMAVTAKQNRYTCAKRIGSAEENIVIIGESVYAASLAAALSHEYGCGVRVFCPLKTADGILTDRDRVVASEGELKALLAGVGTVIADPLYQPLCPAGTRFIPLGHEAFSGRLYQESIPNLIDHFDTFARKVTERKDTYGAE